MTLGEFENLLRYINLYHNPENNICINKPAHGYEPRMVTDITCKAVLMKNWLPVGRISHVNITLDTGEERSFDVMDENPTKIKMWLLTGEDCIDWYGLTFLDIDRREKLFSQMRNFGDKLNPKDLDRFKGVSAMEFLKGFLGWLNSDPFYMSDDELFRKIEEHLSSV